MLTPKMPQKRGGKSTTPRRKLPSSSVLGTSANAAALSVTSATVRQARGTSRSARSARESSAPVAPHSTSTGM